MWEGRDFAALLEWWCEWLLREEGRYLLPWPTAELNSTAFFLLFL